MGSHAYYNAAGNLYIANNAVHMQSTTNGTYGIFTGQASKVHVTNNTVRNASTSGSSYGIYMTGFAAFTANSTNYPASSDMRLVNNLVHMQGGYPVYVTDPSSMSALAQGGVNHNLYYTTGSSLGYFNGTTITGNILNIRNAVYTGSDSRSLVYNVPFESSNSLRIDATSPAAWFVNGRAMHIFSMDRDISGAARSITPATGAPDLGAYELKPTSQPLELTITGSIGAANTQHLVELYDTLGSITWGSAGSNPDSLTARYYPGSLISDPTGFGVNFPANYMDAMWNITPYGGSFYSYDLNLKYDPIMMGTIVAESDIRMARRTGTDPWSPYTSTATTLDTVNRTFGISSTQPEMGDFTGTDDISPLPVTLSDFNAKRAGSDAALTWTTASETNNEKFIIERSFDGRNFTKVGEVEGKGTTTEVSNYGWLDANPMRNSNGATTVYYRLRQVDFDGTSTLSDKRAVDFGTQRVTSNIVAYPNPGADELNVMFESSVNATTTISVVDFYGKEVLSGTYSTHTGLNRINLDNASGLAAGVYAVRVETNGQTEVIKVIRK
jgi:hypothetical protein